MSEGFFLPPNEVAELLGIPASTLRFWSWSGTAPEGFPSPVKVGRLTRYPKAAVISWAEERIEAAQVAP